MRIFAVEVSLQARHRDPPPSSDLDGRTEPSRATQAVESVGVQTDAPGGFRNRNEIAGRVLSTDLFEPRESRRRSRGHESPSFFGPEGPSLTGPTNRHHQPHRNTPHAAMPPALHGVKSPTRLATTSGGLPIVHVRPAGELARSSCSAQGYPRRDWTPLRCRWWSPVMRTTQRRRSHGTPQGACSRARRALSGRD